MKHVRDSLYTLMTVAPSDVFAVMADDCRGSEEETGASRRNILDFLYHDARDARRDILETGSNLEAEKFFREGFTQVLRAVPQVDVKPILEMLLPLSTISGKDAIEAAKAVFFKTLTHSVPRDSPVEAVWPIIGVFVEFIKRAEPRDSRYPLLFLAAHGPAVVELGLQKQDNLAKKVLDHLDGWVEDAVARWGNGEGTVGEQDVLPQSLVPAFVSSILPTLLVRTSTISGS